MSRIGRKPVEIPKGVTLTVQDSTVKVKGPVGEITVKLPSGITAKVEGDRVEVSAQGESAEIMSLFGTIRSLIQNAVTGASKGFSKNLEIQGVGFKAALQGQKLTLALGFSHPIVVQIPDGITVKVTPDGVNVSVSGADKHMVGDLSARVRGYFPAEPYKGKGVRYKGEHVRRKAGKAVA